MTSVHGFCTDCGSIDVPLGALSVELPDDVHVGSYTYTCPSCAGLVREPAGRHLAEVLVAFGAPVAGTADGAPEVSPVLPSFDDGLARVHFFAA
jgi:hypothetical protein